MSETLTKADVLRAMNSLPDDATVEDAIERLAFLHRIEVGLAQVREGRTTPHAEVEARFRARWGDQDA